MSGPEIPLTGINPQALINFIESAGLLPVRGPYKPSWRSTKETNLIVALLLLRNGHPEGFLTAQHMYDFGHTLQSVAQVVAAQCGLCTAYVIGLAHGWDERKPSHRDSLTAFVQDRDEFLRGAEDGRKAGELAGLRFKYPGHTNPDDFLPDGPTDAVEERPNDVLTEWRRHLDRQFGYKPKPETPPPPPTSAEIEKLWEECKAAGRASKASRKLKDEQDATRKAMQDEAEAKRAANRERQQKHREKARREAAKKEEKRQVRQEARGKELADFELDQQSRRVEMYGGGSTTWLPMIRGGQTETLAARASSVLGVTLPPPAFLVACRNWIDSNGTGGDDWSSSTWAMWLKQRAVEVGAYRVDSEKTYDIKFYTLLHVGFINIDENPEHLANLRREAEERRRGPNYARSRIGHTEGWASPIDRTAARVADVETYERHENEHGPERRPD